MSLNALMQNIDEWCGTPIPGHPPRPTVAARHPHGRGARGDVREPRHRVESNDLYEAARDLYKSAAERSP